MFYSFLLNFQLCKSKIKVSYARSHVSKIVTQNGYLTNLEKPKFTTIRNTLDAFVL